MTRGYYGTLNPQGFDAKLSAHNVPGNGWYKDYLELRDDFYLHPDAKKWISDEPYSTIGKPYSKGCIIPHIGDFNNFTNEMKNLGYSYGYGNSREQIHVEIKLFTQLQQSI
ncbi:hypothetical protein [Spirochaeta cellobiosiphila]|uniref:hypothetical protein n=1 Tax=Spirochaeta cellobiosiphila TaxID=504483 RepID=UPI00041C393B|nr:hypothetical protein [Spirochaeta cellobiosiphila]